MKQDKTYQKKKMLFRPAQAEKHNLSTVDAAKYDMSEKGPVMANIVSEWEWK